MRTCDAALTEIFGADLHAGADRLEAFLEDLGVSAHSNDYGVARNKFLDLIAEALEGERGLNFIGTREAVLEAVS